MRLSVKVLNDGRVELWEDNALACTIPSIFIKSANTDFSGMHIELVVMKDWSVK